MKELQNLDKYEDMPELEKILEQNFLQYSTHDYDKKEAVPRQMLSYLRNNYKKYRDIPEDSPEILKEARGRWYVPDPNQAIDPEKLRNRALLKEFNEYVTHIKNSKKKLKKFRLEAIRCGFKQAWQDKDYKTIVDIGNRIPDKVIQEDQTLLMYYDNAGMFVEN